VLPALAHLVESGFTEKHLAAPESAHHDPEPQAAVEPLVAAPVASAESAEAAEVEPEVQETVATQIEPEHPEMVDSEVEPTPEVQTVAAPQGIVSSEPVAPMGEETQPTTQLATQPESVAAASALSSEAIRSAEAERIHQAVERVFDRFKPLLIAAIVRELARLD
jgi:hypothetical protein